MLDVTMREMKGTHVGFIPQITGKRARCQANRAWETPAAEEFLHTAGIKLENKYIGIQKVKVAQLVALYQVLKVCVWDTRHKGGGAGRDGHSGYRVC